MSGRAGSEEFSRNSLARFHIRTDHQRLQAQKSSPTPTHLPCAAAVFVFSNAPASTFHLCIRLRKFLLTFCSHFFTLLLFVATPCARATLPCNRARVSTPAQLHTAVLGLRTDSPRRQPRRPCIVFHSAPPSGSQPCLPADRARLTARPGLRLRGATTLPPRSSFTLPYTSWT